MGFTLDQFHSDCRQVSNASIICADGVIFTHKMVLAHISSLMKTTLKEIPTADEATIYLQDFSKEEVELFMSEMSLGQKIRNTDLLLLFGNKSVSPVKDSSDDLTTSPAGREVKVKDGDDEDCEAEEHLFSDTFSNHDVFPSDENLEELDDKIEDVTDECKKELTESPQSHSEKMTNKRIDKKIRYEKALALYKSSNVTTYKQAAEQFGVCHNMLRKYNNEGYSYLGQGEKTSKRFTREEEIYIKERVLEITEGGTNFTLAILKKVILEEAEIVKVNQPERYFLGFPTKQILSSYCGAFRRKHGLGNNANTEINEEKEVMEKEEMDPDEMEKKEMDPDEMEEFERKTQEQIREYEKDLIENPLTEKQRVVNQKIEMKIRYEKALAALKTGRVQSYRQASIIYGVNGSTLRKFILSGTSYKGKGMELSRFTAEEEKIIADRIWKLIEGGSLLTARMVKNILLEEAEIIKVNQPDRTEQMTFASIPKLWSFIHAFTKRHEMDKICDAENRKDREQRRTHECEICYNTYTFQKSLRDHRKKCQSFLDVRS